MKPFEQYIQEAEHFFSTLDVIDLMSEEQFNEDSAPASTTTGGVASSDAPPMFKKEKVFGHPCISVDSGTYNKCVQGKVPFKRWTKYVENDKLRDEMRTMFKRNKKMLVKNEETGTMVFVR
jgi:hypothetical protein